MFRALHMIDFQCGCHLKHLWTAVEPFTDTVYRQVLVIKAGSKLLLHSLTSNIASSPFACGVLDLPRLYVVREKFSLGLT